jgi:hypothetical protein
MPIHDRHWTFGKNCHINFPGGGDPIVDTDHAFQSDEGCATWSDGSGSLSFYTNGQGLWDGNHNPVPSPPLGGAQSSTHSAIIVPRAGGGSRFHIFAMQDWAGGSIVGPLTYTAVTVTGTNVNVVAGPAPVTFGPARATERLAAVPHADCDRYWVVSMHMEANLANPTLFAMLIDSDQGPSPGNTWTAPYPYPPVRAAYWMGFSPDGTKIALSTIFGVDILTFNRATGAFGPYARMTGLANPNDSNGWVYGTEFSPDGRFVYFTGLHSGEVRRFDVTPGTHSWASTHLIGTVQPTTKGSYRLGALQRGPNGKLYGVKFYEKTLFEISDPNNNQPANVGFKNDALDANASTLTLNDVGVLGLPTFTRIATDCLGDRCDRLAAQVNAQLAATPEINLLWPCDDRQPIEKPECAPIKIPPLAPWTSIRWGDSRCDCIEGDDTEVMNVTVCNPYSNLTLAGLTIQAVTVVDMNGNPVPNLPDGSPSIELTPIGPHCFGDLAPCACVTRQFVLRLRGAVPGPCRILLKGICFDACFHGDEEDCFVFHVCKD